VCVTIQSYLFTAAELVGFLARGVQYNEVLPEGSPVKFKYEYFNVGKGYNSATGKFTAPTKGWYYFIVDVTPDNIQSVTPDYRLMVDSTGVLSAYSISGHKHYTQELRNEAGWPYDPITRITRAPGVVYLNKGQTVWVESDGYHDYQKFWSHHGPVFCGYMIAYE
jgi:hypothetical protein